MLQEATPSLFDTIESVRSFAASHDLSCCVADSGGQLQGRDVHGAVHAAAAQAHAEHPAGGQIKAFLIGFETVIEIEIELEMKNDVIFVV